MKCAHVYAHEGDYTFKQSDHYFTSSLCNYKRIRPHSKCEGTPYFEPYPIPNNSVHMNACACLISGYFIWEREKKKKKKNKVFWSVERGKTPKWRENNFYFKSMELHSVKVIMGCRQ